ncbi:hypothetical protein ABZ930_27680 [Streptomyces sp. NPDC046716]|uniref:restriction endonuclease subunit S n=1 Tax=Streptomyces sp. NPDC046716 TaxID=3157093 RepID=UPI0033D42BF4
MSESKAVVFRALLTTTKDGDWGKGEPQQGHAPVNVIRGTDFAEVSLGRIAGVPLRYLSQKTLHRRLLRADDILIETAGGSRDRPTGRTVLISQEVLDAFSGDVTCASFARFLRVDPVIANPRYVYWYLQYLYARGDMWVHQVQHTGVARFQFTRFAETEEVPLPIRAEQDAIADLLGTLDAKISSNERIAATINELGGALFRGPVERSPRLITDVASVIMGQSPPGDTYNEIEAGLPFYQGTRDFGVRYPGHRIWCTAVTRRAYENDVLVSVRAPVGEINVATEECGIGRGVAAVRSAQYPHVLLQALSSDPSVWLPYEAEGTVFGSINKKQFLGLELSWPSGQAIDGLESQLKALDGRLRQVTEESKTLADLRATLLPQLMSGRFRVKDAEKIVEDHA